MTCDAWSVVVVPFPFSDSAEAKSRPAVVLSTRSFNRGGLSIMAMVTSAHHSRMSGASPFIHALPSRARQRAKDTLTRFDQSELVRTTPN